MLAYSGWERAWRTPQDRQQTQKKTINISCFGSLQSISLCVPERDATCTRPLKDRGREDMGAGGEEVLDVIVKREGRNATNGCRHKTHSLICSPSLLPTDPTSPPAHDRRSCLHQCPQCPSSVPSKHFTARVRATHPALSPSETLCLWKQHAHRIQIKTNMRRHTDACNTTRYLSFFSAFYFLLFNLWCYWYILNFFICGLHFIFKKIASSTKLINTYETSM